MSLYQLSSTRLVLERARVLLREREDLSARSLLGAVGEVCSAIAVAEAIAPSPHEAAFLLARAKALVERTRSYADAHKLHFLIVLTPAPGRIPGVARHDTAQSMSADGILSAIAEMKRGATSPPEEVQRAIEDGQRVSEVHDTIPSPPETLSDIPASRSSAPPPSFRTFSEGDDEADE